MLLCRRYHYIFESDVQHLGRESDWGEVRTLNDRHDNLYAWNGDHLHGHVKKALETHGANFGTTRPVTAGPTWYPSMKVVPELRGMISRGRANHKKAMGRLEAA
jgi:hypothetical protein